MLTAARREYDQQQRLTALAVAEATRLGARGSVAVARSVQTYQAAAVQLSLEALAATLAEQSISTTAEATVAPYSLLTATQAVATMVGNASSVDAVARLVQTLVTDASRTTRAVDQATRPAVTGYVRSLQVPSCGRCAILAGRVYRYSQGFLRHPRCDCLMTPTNEANGRHLVTDPTEAFRRGQIRGLSAADVASVNAGADLGKVLNVRRKAAGLTVGSSVISRAGVLTPQGCLTVASDRAQALELLRKFGYIT